MKDCGSSRRQSQVVVRKLEDFVKPLLVTLDKQLDARLVRTFVATRGAILAFRHSRYGLLLSELGGYITLPEKSASRDQAVEQSAAVVALASRAYWPFFVAAGRSICGGQHEQGRHDAGHLG